LDILLQKSYIPLTDCECWAP